MKRNLKYNLNKILVYEHMPFQVIAYRLVHSLHVSVYFFLSVLNNRAISGTRGSSGFGSDISAHIDRRTTKEK